MRQKHGALITLCGRETLLEETDGLVVHVSSQEDFVYLREIGPIHLLHGISQSQIYARQDERRMAQGDAFHELNQLIHSGLAIKQFGI